MWPAAMTETKPQTWIVDLEEDPETGDLVMPLPLGLLASMGWQIGDTLTWDVSVEDGVATLSRQDTINDT